MSGPIVGVFVAAALLLVLAIALFLNSRKLDIDQVVLQRFRHLTRESVLGDQRPARHSALVDWWERKLIRAGLQPSRKNALTMLSVTAMAFLLGVIGWDGKGLLLPGLALLGAHLYLEHRSRLRGAAMLAQLPGFVDQVVRSLGVGHTMEHTVLVAADQCRPPLRDVLDRVRVNVELGAHLGEELQQAARIHRLRELQLLALAVQVNQRFGGSARDLLQSIVTMIQQRDQAQRELRALTGETRLSAWVLGLLPVCVGAYMLAMNPAYLDFMWQDVGGRKILMAALGMQVVGAVILWRMVRTL